MVILKVLEGLVKSSKKLQRRVNIFEVLRAFIARSEDHDRKVGEVYYSPIAGSVPCETAVGKGVLKVCVLC
ncbi:hypothetical protein COT69_02070 [candidate division WWE3 bacterium CG09_land_8_20_14_0_10_39_24]|uniref:Uncharacterized protein n=2 Tax=Katanobacteria TaxID=422282 RepID=A0A2G9XD50_UNCKA|nr:MAG: hypothetical protein AUJ94_00120 [bacterium CG2_30_40_12]OJI08823.1 MAG: hypothetical protein BK003_02045 [bacterium CG09_39_24]PIP04867.1 MAG: hypothetical protein COX53_00140 [candidate division WWE3 bacterium CG23_combo_of_CG06-09_8_20_14_all_40_14]PIS12850.1 MAG: hypothetical protein COT69_02070 [candidate division WWE3 bacterium CG09_land_8_20_14_0_10_39_24]PJE50587.1 MAG: hypothetical protein COV27_02805 [candidate division WWE3 bacterium CG10_big_fil_rev_8_21_14_0_10_39_14]